MMENEKRKCPYCNSTNTELIVDEKTFDSIIYSCYCRNCGRKFQ